MLRNSIIALFICIFLLAVFPFMLYLIGVNIFSNDKTVPVVEKTTISEALGGLIRSEDAGMTWQNVARSENPTFSFPRMIYAFVVHPKDADVMYLGGRQSGLWKSINGGRTWNTIVDQSGVLDLHADMYDIEIDPVNPDILFVAVYQKDRGRVLRSEDGGAHMTEYYATSLDRIHIFDMVLDSKNTKHILAVTGDGALIETINSGQTWRIKKLFTKPIVRLVANPTTIQELYAINIDGDVFKSVTGGDDWSDAPIGLSQSRDIEYPPKVFDFFSDSQKGIEHLFFLDPSHSSRVYWARDNTLLRSQDKGLTWQEMTLLFAKESLPVTAVAIDPHESNTIFVAAAKELHQSRDDGLTWHPIPLPMGIGIKKIIIHPKHSDIMFAIVY